MLICTFYRFLIFSLKIKSVLKFCEIYKIKKVINRRIFINREIYYAIKCSKRICNRIRTSLATLKTHMTKDKKKINRSKRRFSIDRKEDYYQDKTFIWAIKIMLPSKALAILGIRASSKYLTISTLDIRLGASRCVEFHLVKWWNPILMAPMGASDISNCIQ